ncbi:MAG: hypothetical protein LQ352_004743 [Teloschistes flavicans]|nr:MAG: hypothetical protein LQ352_004743 [Teloschistes flavicans]
MSPIPASTSSKSRLKAFQFHESPEKSKSTRPRPAKPQLDDLAEKENLVPNQIAMATSQLLPCPPPSLSQHSQPKECPQTPIGRLPLSELIAAVDENANQNLNLTPVERVLWQHTPGSSQTASSQDGPRVSKGKKRARSSSPASSSQNEGYQHFPREKQSFDVQTLQKNLTTPQADPAGDLWTKYSLKVGGIHTGSPTKNETFFAELLKSSSPQTPDSHVKTRNLGGLRRAISCANEWPTSVRKRRRLNPGSSQDYALDDHPKENKVGDTRMSRVNFLVEQVQKGLLKGRKENQSAQNAGISSSSSPDKRGSPDQSQSSPSRATRAHDDQESNRINPHFFSREIGEQPENLQDRQVRVPDKASEFGDDDFDDYLLEAVDVELVSKQQIYTPTAKIMQAALPDQQPSTRAPSPLRPPIAPHFAAAAEDERSDSPMSNSKGLSAPNARPSIPSDEFDDDDDNDMTAADLEDLVALYDQQSNKQTREVYKPSARQKSPRKPSTSTNAPRQPLAQGKSIANRAPATVIDVSSDEEFGEGIDFEDVVAECTAPSSNVPSVRSIRTV